MSLIFDLRKETLSWANSINEALSESWPDYFKEFGEVGSEDWWKNYDDGRIPITKSEGMVSFIGKRTDQFNEEWDTVELSDNGKLIECDQVDYWKSDEITLGKKVYVESFEISFQHRYGPMKFVFESLVSVIEP
jgi:hypothetical protein